MTDRPDTGGTAFPVTWNSHVHSDGMTLRDYAAIHADQPGVAEILKAAGLCPEYKDRYQVFEKLWYELSNEERFSLSAKVRYQQADAMLRERQS